MSKRDHIHLPKNPLDKASDVVAAFVGSWAFVGIHMLWFIAWVLFRVEQYPFGLLTLIVSLEAIFLSTFVMISQNRQSDKDHVRDDHEADEVDQIMSTQELQVKILNAQTEILEILKPKQENLN